MAIIIKNVEIGCLSEDYLITKNTNHPITIYISNEQDNLLIRIKDNESLINNQLNEIKIYKNFETARYGLKAYLINDNQRGTLIYFESIHDLKFFMQIIQDFKSDNNKSAFSKV